ncbi:hypothetical protein SAV14893_027930 [Streptomyces avermitilis]|uniref:Uncharacterized protein n=2 Tax=Streptomyces avermitilis TaxID=33903 RepID=Q82HN9_STRAW|nr:hypothetical protein SAVERM_3469 [Streptomyces avermitilis MA-4680 = NBRC 14893]BBJ51358.1 hypothetical protein SAVMC3_39870 [Streptomyces avermitilis]GDY63400.1 hypothetical protein SAV14893_027930 [Streptomyces avermitilis]GDY85401.1 hypothetical protein SAVCW2_46000 [Streptomyces avermitilis]
MRAGEWRGRDRAGASAVLAPQAAGPPGLPPGCVASPDTAGAPAEGVTAIGEALREVG